MSWNALYRIADGSLVSVCTSMVDPLPNGYAVVALASEPDARLERWDQSTHTFVVISQKPRLARAVRATYEDWLMWRTLRLEAQARALAAAVITALTNQEDSAWSDLVAAVQAWRAAT